MRTSITLFKNILGASQGKGRGRQVIAVARTADLILMVLDATKKEIHKSLLEAELNAVGIRLNCQKPSIYYKQKKTGGIKFTATCTLTKCDEKMVQRILQEYKIFNAEVLFREDASPEDFIDVIMGNCIYIPCLYIYNKIDQIPLVSNLNPDKCQTNLLKISRSTKSFMALINLIYF